MVKIPFSIGALVLLTACATTAPTSQDSADVYDPYEGWNRGVYNFNDKVDRAVLEPVAKGYRAVTVEPVRGTVSNFLTNLNQPVVFANTILQGKPTAAVDTFARFLVNSTVGLGGLFDPATSLNVPAHREDFGQTLGVWGVPNGPFFMTPFVGANNLRDSVGSVVDIAFNPMTWVGFEGQTVFQASTTTAGVVSGRENLIEAVEVLRDQPEPYIAWRRNYTQSREAAIRDGKENSDPFQNLPDFDEYDLGDFED